MARLLFYLLLLPAGLHAETPGLSLRDPKHFELTAGTSACAGRTFAAVERGLQDPDSMTTALALRARKAEGAPLKVSLLGTEIPKTGGRFDTQSGVVKIYCRKKGDPAESFRHELAHLLMLRAQGGVPEDKDWVEGFASYVAGEKTPADSVAGALRLEAGPAAPATLDRLLAALPGAKDLKGFLKNYNGR